MTFWIIAAALAALVLGILLAAGLRGGASAPGRDHDLAVYRDQLAELERDKARGVIGDGEAAAAEVEIKRRMLAAAERQASVAAAPGGPRRWPFVAAAVVPCAGIALYMALGRPDLADSSIKVARGPTAEDMRRAARMSPEARAKMIRGMVEGLAARLKANPDDFAGWMRLGRAWSVLQEFSKAAAAYGQAMRLRPRDAGAIAGFIASRVRSLPPNASLPPDLREAVGRLALLQPNHPLALYLGGAIAAEAKKYDLALRLWRALLARLPAESPLAPVLKQRIAAAEKARDADKANKPDN